MLILPVFLFFTFGALQIAQLGVALAMAHYAASSVARKVANERTLIAGPGTINMLGTPYWDKSNSLMIADMQLDSVLGCVQKEPYDLTAPTANLTVAVRAKVQAWPFFGDLLHGAWGATYDASQLQCKTDLEDPQGMGPFNYSAGPAPYFFYVTGRAKVRLNYVP